MEKIINNNKILIISHIGDIDGMGAVILGYLAFKNIDYLLIEVNEQQEMLNFIKEIDYERIYICDLGIENQIGDEINLLNKNILLFDHHISNTYVNKYSFATVEVTLNGRKTSGTELFYDYLVREKFLKTNNRIIDFVELIRSYDTWDWQSDKNLMAKDLTTLFNILGTTLFINYFTKDLIKEENFIFSNEHQFLIDLKEKEINEVIMKCNNAMIKIDFENLIAGVVFSDRYSSLIGSYLSSNQEIDFAMVIKMNENKVSLRSNNEINVSIIAKKYGGGGHKNAAGFPLTNKMKKTLLNLIVDNLN